MWPNSKVIMLCFRNTLKWTISYNKISYNKISIITTFRNITKEGIQWQIHYNKKIKTNWTKVKISHKSNIKDNNRFHTAYCNRKNNFVIYHLRILPLIEVLNKKVAALWSSMIVKKIFIKGFYRRSLIKL